MSEYVGGLDLGQTSDPSALALLRKDGREREAVYTLLVLRRFELRTMYRSVIVDSNKVMTTGDVKGSALAIDQTGVGRPLVELAREVMVNTPIIPVTITGGSQATEQEDGWHVPKRALVSALSLVHQGRRLVVPAKLTHGKTLAREMENFKVKITLSANETFEAWRSSQHDDLVLAVATAVWCGERFCLGEVHTGQDNPPPGRYDDPDEVRERRGGYAADRSLGGLLPPGGRW